MINVHLLSARRLQFKYVSYNIVQTNFNCSWVKVLDHVSKKVVNQVTSLSSKTGASTFLEGRFQLRHWALYTFVKHWIARIPFTSTRQIVKYFASMLMQSTPPTLSHIAGNIMRGLSNGPTVSSHQAFIESRGSWRWIRIRKFMKAHYLPCRGNARWKRILKSYKIKWPIPRSVYIRHLMITILKYLTFLSFPYCESSGSFLSDWDPRSNKGFREFRFYRCARTCATSLQV